MIPGGFYHFERHHSPLRNAQSFAEIETYPVPDRADWSTDHMADEVALAHRNGRVAHSSIGHMYETAWQIRGYEPFLMDMIERPEWSHCMLEKLFARNLNVARAGAAAGVDMLSCGDDVANQNAMMFSPEMWRRMNHSRWSKLWRMVKEISPATQIWYHSDALGHRLHVESH